MEMKTLPHPLADPIAVRFAVLFAAAATLVVSTSNTNADPVAELASFSVFGKVDPSQLTQSDIKAVRGAPMTTPRFLSVQICYVTPGSPAQTIEAMRKWNPGKHPELKVFLYNDFSGSPGAGTFARLQSASINPAVRALVDKTQKLSTDLQISREEAKKFSPTEGTTGGGMPAAIAKFWSGVLAGRAQAFISGGSSAQPPYDHTGQAIKPAEELAGLLRQQPAIRKQFSGLIDSAGIGGGGGSLKPELYWELLEVDTEGILTLGASYRRGGGGGTYQAADVLYYASGGYNVSLTLYQLWPVDVGGRASTLVWRGNMVSSAALASLRGIERMGAETSMIKDISRVVSIFRRDTSGGR